ncbi:junctional adhesion molecule B-like isoform X2 [Antedon mediterranea]|uniref:junctional adhesion molecule B-like isoform X2 n=1 Tax=Antedon mediterranea TaxID=105859 RepID=UPI003AF9D611
MTINVMYHQCLIMLLLMFVSDTCAQTQVTVDAGTAKVDEAATMTCTYTLEPNDSLLQLAWAKADDSGQAVGSALVTTGQPNNDRYSLSNDNLIITDVVRGDADNYRCSVSTVGGNSAENFANLTVYYLEVPDLQPVEFYATLNKTATFTCTKLEGLPTPITVTTWIKDGNPLGVSNTDKYPSSDATLTINNIVEEDEGMYQCRAENAAYSGTNGKLSNTAKLTLEPFVPTDPPESVNGGLIGGVVSAVSVVLVFIGIFVCYQKGIACFKTPACNVTKEGPSEVIGLTNDDDVTYAQVQKTAKSKEPEKTNNAPAKPKRAETNDTKKPDANAELTYVEVDHRHSGKGNKIIRTEPETTYSSVQPSIKR